MNLRDSDTDLDFRIAVVFTLVLSVTVIGSGFLIDAIATLLGA